MTLRRRLGQALRGFLSFKPNQADSFEHTGVLRTSLGFPLSTLMFCLCVGLISGCGAHTSSSSGLSDGAILRGLVNGGQQPVVGASIYLYAAGTTGYGTASTSLLNTSISGVRTDGSGNAYVTTDAAGTFNITGNWSCLHGTDQVYILALGGNPGLADGTNNSALALMAALGTCSSLGSTYPNIVIDEVTTVASVWALQQFILDATHVGAPSTNATGVSNAFAQVNNLVSIEMGRALAKTTAGNGIVPQAEINTLANLLSSCVNSPEKTSAPCSSLFLTATPSGKTQSSDTIDAALDIARNPGNNVLPLFLQLTAIGPFQPELTTAPNDWMLFVTLTGGGLNGPTSLGVDAAGDLWVSNYSGSVSEFSPLGLPVSATGYIGHGLEESFGLAVDRNNNIWITNEESSGANGGLGTVTELNGSGQPLSGSRGYSGGGIYFPVAVAADSNGNMWIVNYGDSKVTLLNSSGTPLSGATGWGGTSLEFPAALAVDSGHNAWVADQSGDKITKISADGSTNTVISCCDGASGIATDQSNNVWVTNYYGDSISEVSSSGVVLLSGITGGGVLHPHGIAIDGAGAVWITNYRGNSISELSGASSSSSGTFLSPITGFATNASLLEPYGLALDASGNAWVSNYGNDTITQFIGIATPIKTPFAGPTSIP